MPFRSQAQREWMHANKPEMAKEWEAATPPGTLPDRVSRNPHAKQKVNRKAYKRKSIMKYRR